MSSSPGGSSFLSSSDETTDAKELQRLDNLRREMNDCLVEEALSRRADFDEISTITAQLEKLHVMNTKLAVDNRELAADRDDLAERLKLNVQLVEKARLEAESDKCAIEEIAHTEIKEMKASIERDRDNHERESAVSRKRQHELAKEVRMREGERDEALSTIEQIITAAKTHFLVQFRTCEELLQYLQQPKSVDVVPECVVPDDRELKQARKRIKKLKKIACDSKKMIEECVAEKEAVVKESEVCDGRNRGIIRDLKSKIALMQAEIVACKNNCLEELRMKDEAIVIIEEREAAVLADCQEKLKEAQVVSSDEQTKLKSENRDLRVEIEKLKSSIRKLRQENTDVIAQVQSVEQQRDEYIQTLKSHEEKELMQAEEFYEAKQMATSAIIERDDLKEQCATAKAELVAARSSFKQSENAFVQVKGKMKQTERALELVKTALMDQKGDMELLTGERMRLLSLLKKQNIALEQAERYCIATESKCKKQSEETIVRLEQFAKEKTEIQEHDAIPHTCWYCPDFPKPLCARIEEIAGNPGLPDTAKLRHIMVIIARYYTDQKSSYDNAITTAEDRIGNIMSNFDEILRAIEPITGVHTVSAKFCASDAFQRLSLTNALASAQQKHVGAEILNRKLRCELAEIFDILQVKTTPEALSTISAMFESAARAAKKIESMSARGKKADKVMCKMEVVASQERREVKEIERNLQLRVKSLEARNKRVTEACDSANVENTALKTRIAQLERQLQEKSNALTNDQRSAAAASQAKVQHIMEEHAITISAKDHEIKELQTRSAGLEREITQWKRSIEYLTAAKLDSERKRERLTSENHENMKSHSLLADRNIADMKAQYDQAAERMKCTNEKLRQVVANYSTSLDEAESIKKSLISENADLASRNEQLTMKIAASEDDQRRGHQICDAKIKAIQIAESTEKQAAVETVLSQFSDEKRKIYAFVAQEFPQMIDIRRRFDDDSFKSLVTNASAELKRCLKQETEIRRLLGLSSDESCSNAISQMLLSLYRPSH